MPKSNANLALKGLDEMFSTEESRQEQKREQVQQIPIEELFPFKEHPFKVLDDEAMQRTVESVAQYGVLAPLIARPRRADCRQINLRVTVLALCNVAHLVEEAGNGTLHAVDFAAHVLNGLCGLEINRGIHGRCPPKFCKKEKTSWVFRFRFFSVRSDAVVCAATVPAA